MNEFLTNIYNKLAELGIPVKYMSATDQTTDFMVYYDEVFDKEYDRRQGQIVIEVHSNSTSALVTYCDTIENSLDDYTYAGTESAADFSFVTKNDISEISSLRYMRELRFEYNLYL